MASPLVTLETQSYGGWPNCLRLSNGRVDLLITTDVGPRILRVGFVGGPNLFTEFPDDRGRTGDSHWRPYGGHRLWHAPENQPRTYFPDNEPVGHNWDGTTLVLRQPVETTTGIAKEIHITLSSETDHVHVEHRLTNTGLWDIQLAPWALSVMAPGGRAIVPQEPFVPFPDELLPARPLVLWPYTDMADPRFHWGSRFIQFSQNAELPLPQKIGLRNTAGWGAYELRGHVFLKIAKFISDAVYPDFGCNWELYTNTDMLEMETLGPLATLKPGATVDHVETWLLLKANLSTQDNELETQMPDLVAKL